jgi:1-phosphofructokinase
MIYTFTANPSLDRTVELEYVKLGVVNRGILTRINAGGKGINVSRFLKTLGMQSQIVSFLGGSTGKLFKSELANEKMNGKFFKSGGETRMNITLINKSENEITKINEMGPGISLTELKKLQLYLDGEFKKDDLWVFSGNLAPGFDQGFYSFAIKKAKAKGCICLLDSSGNPLFLAIESSPQILHINNDEADFLAKKYAIKQGHYVELANLLISKGIQLVIISLGENGAIFFDRNNKLLIEPPKILCKSSVGAGDALVAGIIFGKMNNYEFIKMANYAVSVGCAKVMESSTNSFSYENIESVLPRNKIEIL